MWRFFVLSIVVCWICPVSSQAHDFWIQPDTFYPKANKLVKVRWFLGEDFGKGEERGFQKKSTSRFELFSSRFGKINLVPLCKEGQKPVRTLRLKKNTGYWLIMNRKARNITLTPKKFTSYLKHEGLTNIIKMRKKRGEAKKPGRERYSRYLRCYLQTGKGDGKTWKSPPKQRLEIIPLSNPAKLRRGDKFQVKVVFDGKPLRKAPIFAYHQLPAKKFGAQSTKTNAKGVATFQITRAGVWIVRLVHMRRDKIHANIEWESFWGAMTFGVRKRMK